MTDHPAVRRRPSLPATAGYLALTVIVAGLAYVTWDTERQVRDAHDERNSLRAEVAQLSTKVQALQVANARKDAEIKRLTALLIARGIDPRPSPTPTAIASTARAARPAVAATSSPDSDRPAAQPTQKPTPARSPSPTRPPSPSPSPTCIHLPILGCRR